MNLLLELMRAAINRRDDVTAYSAAIKAHLIATGGCPPRNFLTVYDEKASDWPAHEPPCRVTEPAAEPFSVGIHDVDTDLSSGARAWRTS
ncbi:MAG TPA: hypothetical protein VJ649_02840 [Actinomycetes bacterium]|nr:hypothetical protein [Actinomycetes bacterium]